MSGNAFLRLGAPAVAAGLFAGFALAFAGVGRAASPSVIHACVQKASGGVRIPQPDADKDDGCKANEVALSWSVIGPPGPVGPTGPQGTQGPAGPPGTFGGTFASPGGQCSLGVADTGITLACPNARLTLDAGGTVRIDAARVVVNGTTATDVQSGGRTAITGTQVTLNGSCAGVTRQGDPITGAGILSEVGIAVTGTISGGSHSVAAC